MYLIWSLSCELYRKVLYTVQYDNYSGTATCYTAVTIVLVTANS